MVWAVLYAAQGPLFLVTLSTMLSTLALLEVACPLAAFGSSMRPWYHLQYILISIAPFRQVLDKK